MTGYVLPAWLAWCEDRVRQYLRGKPLQRGWNAPWAVLSLWEVVLRQAVRKGLVRPF